MIVQGYTCANCKFFVPAGYPHCCAGSTGEASMDPCAEAFELIHAELVSIADDAAQMIVAEKESDDEHSVRAAIYQTN